MKKMLLKSFSVILTLMFVLTLLPLGIINAEQAPLYDYERDGSFRKIEIGNGLYRYYGPTGEFNDDFDNASAVISNSDDYYKSQNLSKKEIASLGADELPKSVDLSLTKYFPPVGDQEGLGSCSTFSAVYYQMSYEVNKIRDVQATRENTRSPQIVYNFVGSGSNGVLTHIENFKFLSIFGAPTYKEVPYSDDDSKNWFAEKGIWREGIRARLDDYFMIKDIGREDSQITSPDDYDLIAYKTALNDGKIIGYSTYVSSWVCSKIKQNSAAPENAKFKDQECVLYRDGSDGAHAMAIVGYNDEIWCDINNNDTVDAGEMGAFKIVNSWSDRYANDGFNWVAYDALNQVSAVENGPSNREAIFQASRIINARDYNDLSDMYIEYTLNTADRSQHNVFFTAEKDGTISKYQMFYGSGGWHANTGQIGAFDGTDVACDGTFVCPLDNIAKDFTYEEFESYNWSIEFEDTKKDSIPVIVKDVRLVDEVNGNTYVVSQNDPCVLDGNSVSYDIKKTTENNKVIYYMGYDNPTLHYKSGNGEFCEVEMEETLERIGATHKYIIKDVKDEVTLYFSDDKGNIDDNGGSFYTATDRLNFYRTKSARQEITITDVSIPENAQDTGITFFFDVKTQGGYEPFEYQYTIESLETGESTFIDFDYKYDKSHIFNDAGKYKVTVDIRDHAGDEFSFTKVLDVVDNPFVFKSLTSTNKTHFVGNTSSFKADTEYENIVPRGSQKNLYKFDVKDSLGNIVHTVTKNSTTYNTSKKVSNIDFSYIPEKSGNYTLTVSSKDGSSDYSEKTIAFKVIDKIIGDTDGSGEVAIIDATNVQRYLVNLVEEPEIYLELCDCDNSDLVNIMDATIIQRYIAHIDTSSSVGEVIEYIPPTEPPTDEPTEPPTDPPTEAPKKNKVTFTNSFSWTGMTMYCYYWSDSNSAMTSWPGVAMENIGTNEFNEVMYTFDVPEGATYLIFTNGSKQTTDISYVGGEVRYYPIKQTDSKGNNLVETW
ncbi:MAG: starch-binding protein [Eubacteriales bacterium]|nr:starch-binding protein [Eubacteriales bacterium]